MLNGVLMGLRRREARRRLDAVLDFAELRGLRRAQAQELLVGDDGPARVRRDGPGRRRHHARSTRCSRSATPRSRRSAWTSSTSGARPARRSCSSRTTWATVQSLCHRAMLHPRTASSTFIGDPEETAHALLPAELRRRRTRAPEARRDAEAGDVPDINAAHASHARLLDAAGERGRERRAGDADPARRAARGRAASSSEPIFVHPGDERRQRRGLQPHARRSTDGP